MRTRLTIREFARLTTAPLSHPSLTRAQVTASAFDWLCRVSAGFSRAGAALVQVEDGQWLRWDSYVGVLETPCGTTLEILPKHVADDTDPEAARALLTRMIAATLDLPAREAEAAALQRFDAPLSEWLMGRFLGALDQLVKRGLRAEYQRIESVEPFLRGQLDAVRQLRQAPGRQHLFALRYDAFLMEGPENCLLKRALEIVGACTQDAGQWRLAQELRHLLHEIPASRDLASDFRHWRGDRLMAHYRPLRPLCELILYRQMPLALAGEWHGISMLFPMEKLFERYVEQQLRARLPAGARLMSQVARHSLCEHQGTGMFRLQPDLLLEHEGRRWVLDTKWKLLDAANRQDKYGLSQADFYQMFAYGQRYLQGCGDMLLIYPRHPGFQHPLPPFDFGNGLRLWVLPFDLEKGLLAYQAGMDLPFQANLDTQKELGAGLL